MNTPIQIDAFMSANALYRLYDELLKAGRRKEADEVMLMHQRVKQIGSKQ